MAVTTTTRSTARAVTTSSQGNAGNDTADYSARDSSDDLDVTLDTNANDGSTGGGGENDNALVENVLGGAGDDRLVGAPAPEGNLSSGGGGFDTVDYSDRTANLTVTSGSGADDGETDVDPADGNQSEGDNVTAEKIVGGSGNDTLPATLTQNELVGNAGNDTLNGEDDDDTLVPTRRPRATATTC